jgi:SAM-dependent methyltransferase
MEGVVSNQSKAYHPNLNYQSYAGTRGGSNSSSKLRAIHLPNLTGKRFLDLGCNAGFFCAYAKNAGASYVLGIDNSQKVIKAARERHPDLDFLDTGWDCFPEGEFDVVICLSAIHYASNQVRLARDIWTHLFAEGLFILEGGLIDDDILEWTDLPVVAFREIGDRVRHLSIGFLARHLLLGYDWDLIGPSIMQGGDPIPRFVIHARKNQDAATTAPYTRFRLCPAEYSRALAVCAPTIQGNQPSYAYIKALGRFDPHVSPEDVASVLSDPEAMAHFVDDVAYALSNHGAEIELMDSLGEKLTSRLAVSLQERNIAISIVTASDTNTQSMMRRMEAGVEFSNAGQTPGALTQVLGECTLSGAKVIDLSGMGATIWQQLVDGGATECHLVMQQDMTSPDSRVTIHVGQPWEVKEQGFDLAFFDITVVDDFDHVDDVARLTRWLKHSLAPGGQAYLVLRTGILQTDWDVYNQILLTPLGRLPSSDYLYNALLRDFAVRPLIRLADEDNRSYCVTRIFRITPWQRTLVVILGHSQSGKTTLARQFRQIPDAIHLSSDYIFYEVFRLRSKGTLPNCSQSLVDVVGGGSAEEVGNFFRTIEGDAQLFQEYMKLVDSMIPRERRLVSLDLDLRKPERVDELRTFFAEAGFLVWIVTR